MHRNNNKIKSIANWIIEFNAIEFFKKKSEILFEYKNALVTITVLSIVALAYAMTNLTLAGDDWDALLLAPERVFEYYPLTSGRWMQYLLMKVIFGKTFAPVFSIVLAVLLTMISGVLIAKLWGIRDYPNSVILIGFVTLTPYWVEPLSFKIAHVSIALSLFLSVLSVYYLFKSIHNVKSLLPIISSSCLLVLSLAIYQVSIAGFTLVFLGIAIIKVIEESEEFRTNVFLEKYILKSALVSLVSVVIYLLSVKVVRLVTGVNELGHPTYSISTGYVSSIDELLESISALLTILNKFFFEPTHLFPFQFKIIFLVIFSVFFVNTIFWLKPKTNFFVKRYGVFVVLVITFFLTPWFPIIIREDHLVRYNMLYTLGIFYSLFFVVVIKYSKIQIIKSIGIIAGFLSILIFVHQINIAFVGLSNINQRDKFIASQILTRIYSNAKYADLPETKTLAVIGRLPYQTRWPFGSPDVGRGPLTSSIVNSGVFGSQVGRIASLLRLISSVDKFRLSLTEKEKILAQEYADANRPWPHQTSIGIVGKLIIIVLSKPN